MSLFNGSSNHKGLFNLHCALHTLHRLQHIHRFMWIIYRHYIRQSLHPQPKHRHLLANIVFLLAIPKVSMSLHHAKKILRRSLSFSKESVKTQKGHVAVYVGAGEKKRYTIPVSYLNQPLFIDLLSRSEEEFGYDHPMGGLTISCSEDTFLSLISQMRE